MRLSGKLAKDGAGRHVRALWARVPRRGGERRAPARPVRVAKRRGERRRRAARPARALPPARALRPARTLRPALARRGAVLVAGVQEACARRNRGGLARHLVVGLVVIEGVGAAAALAVLPSDSIRSEFASAGALSSGAAQWRVAEGQLVAAAGTKARRAGPSYYAKTTRKHVSPAAEAGFLPVYREAARAFGLSWRLLASVHRQETAFSSVASTYHGLNAFGCCAGPMQFNVTNGPPSTWALYRTSFRKGERPRRYPHPTRHHPSIYDDFDAIMAAAALLRDGGAGAGLDAGAWSAAYAYYGHDAFGTEYASQVVGRAQTWERDGFCVNCPEDASLVAALDDAYGVDARRVLRAADKKKHKKKKKHKRSAADKVADAAHDEAARARREARRDDAEREAGRTAPLPPPAPAPADPATATAPPPAATPTTEPPASAPAPPPPPPCTGLRKVLGC
jgi:hypothetical protein